MATDKIVLNKKGPIGQLVFNNPERHNAVSLEMWDAVEQGLDDFADDDEVRVIIVSGAGGKAFVSGADISKFDSERGSKDAVAHYNARIRAVYQKVHELPKPTLAMINGFCLGGGLALAVSCDLRFCSEKSTFGLPAARLGLGYPYEGLKRLVDAVGPGAAKDIVFTGRRLDAQEALSIGLVQKVLPGRTLRRFVLDYARAIAENAPLTVSSLKIIVGEILKDPAERDIEKCRKLVERCFASEDYIEGRRAFTEKRPPRFKGR